MKKGFVYELVCPISGECRYIGKTIQSLNARLYKHKYNRRDGRSRKNSWLVSLENGGVLNELRIRVLEECDSSLLNDREIYWIAKYREEGFKLTNTTIGGDCGSLGYRHNVEAKRKISEASKKQKGRKLSKETRMKISDSLRGKPGRNTGNKHTDETKQKISQSKQGTISWNAQAVVQMDIDGNILKEWQSGKFAANSLGLSQGNIWMVLNGKRNSCGGFKWKKKYD